MPLPKSVIFTDCHSKMIADFYVQHFDVFRGDRKFTNRVNKERTKLYAELTNSLNAKYGKQFSVQQVHRKLKNMKAECRQLLEDVNNGQRALNGVNPDLPEMSEHESIIVAKMLEHRNGNLLINPDIPNEYERSPPWAPRNYEGLTPYQSPQDSPIRQNDDDDDGFDIGNTTGTNESFTAAQSVQQHFDRAPIAITTAQSGFFPSTQQQFHQAPVVVTTAHSSYFTSPPSVRQQFYQSPTTTAQSNLFSQSAPSVPFSSPPPPLQRIGLRTLTPSAMSPVVIPNDDPSTSASSNFRRIPPFNGAQPKKPQKRKRAPPAADSDSTPPGETELKALKRSVLHLQRGVLQNDLRLQEEKRETMIKLNLAIDEFRRYVAEQRLISRGIDVNTIPVDIPPGLEGLVGGL